MNEIFSNLYINKILYANPSGLISNELEMELKLLI